MSERMMELRNKVDEGVCTVDELREYCYMAFETRMGMWLQEADYYIQPDSMDAFNWLKGWWKLDDYPKQLPAPNLLSFLWGIYVPIKEDGTGPQLNASLNDKILEFATRARIWCEQNGLDPDNLHETPEDKRRRKNRERMDQVRAARRVPDKDIADDSVRAQVRKLEADISEIKVQAKATDEELRAKVVHFQNLMMEASEERKARAAEYKASMESLRSDIKQLTAKQ